MVELASGTMRTGVGATVPTADPGLVLVGSADAVAVDRALGPDLGVVVVDRRPGVTWLEVPDARMTLERLVDRIDVAGSGDLPVAVTRSGATLDEVVTAAMGALPLRVWADRLADADLAAKALDYRIHYQPIVRLDDGEVIGHEALLRATSGGEIIAADELIERATAGGWLAELDLLSRQLAIQGLGPWLGDDLVFLNLLAPDGVVALDAMQQTIDAARARGIDGDQLVFESNERNHFHDLAAAAEDLATLRRHGVRLAIDDAGDGFNGLSAIAMLAPDVLKLAPALTRSIDRPEAAAVVSTVVSLASRSGVWVVAENIETEAQADAMRALGVDWAQGRLFGPPVARATGDLIVR